MKFTKLFLSLIVIFLFSCGDKKSDAIVESNSVEVDSFYLISRVGDTIPTGVDIPLSDTLLWVLPEENLWTDLQNLETETSTFRQAIESYNVPHRAAFTPDSAEVYPFYSDTSRHIENIVPASRTVYLKEPEFVKVQNPTYTSEAILDIQVLGMDHGLPTNNITCLYIDSRQFLWMGTDRGLIRYDGNFMKIYTENEGLPGRNVSSISEDAEGNLWFGFLDKAVAKYDGNILTVFDAKAGDFDYAVTSVFCASDGNIWIGTWGYGLIRYDGEKMELFGDDFGFVTRLHYGKFHETEDGTVWFTNYGRGLWSVKGEDEEFRRYGQQAGMRTSWTLSSYVDDNQDIWLGGTSEDFTKITKDSVLKISVPPQLENEITAFSNDQFGNMWLGTSSGGVFKLEGETLTRITEMDGLSSNSITDIIRDPSGRLLIATDGGGLNLLNLNTFSYITSSQGLPSNEVSGVFETEEAVYYATERGLVKVEDTLMTHYTAGKYKNLNRPGFSSSFAIVPMTDVAVTPSGVIWGTGMNYGFCRIEDGSMRRMGGNAGFPQNASAICLDESGDLWGAGYTRGRLYHYTDTNVTVYADWNGFNIRSMSDMCFDQNGTLWMGSRGSGIASFDGEKFRYITPNEGLSSRGIYDLFVDNDNRLWILTAKGVDYLENGEVKHFNLAEFGITETAVSGIQDKNGTYWFGTNNGLIKMSEQKKESEWSNKNYSIEVIRKVDGLISPVFLNDAMFIDSKGVLYMGTTRGLISISTENETTEITPISYLETIDINGQALDYKRTSESEYLDSLGLESDLELSAENNYMNYPKELVLPYSCNHLTFKYGGINWSTESPSHLSYEYYIEGIDDGWIKGTQDQKADYRNLPYGNFTFHLKALSKNGIESEVFSYSFEILPPWYHTWWARFLFGLIGVLVVWLLIKTRTAQLRKRQAELENTVEERTAEIQHQHEMLEESHKEIRDSIQYAKRIQGAILPPGKLVKEYLSNSFILYEPKDVVAGDFYWMEPVEDGILFAAADCTGHGVPGAMVSVVCNNAMNRAVREFGLRDTGKILDKVRELVIAEFEKSEEEVKDGMDVSLCFLKGNKLEYSGAHNSLWIIRKGGQEVEEIKADKQPIGKFEFAKPFTSHTIELAEGDSIYISSDGYADQFGGEKGKKFKAANFKRLLISIQDKSIDEQKEELRKSFIDWKGDLEQVDDVCVIGLRV